MPVQGLARASVILGVVLRWCAARGASLTHEPDAAGHELVYINTEGALAKRFIRDLHAADSRHLEQALGFKRGFGGVPRLIDEGIVVAEVLEKERASLVLDVLVSILC
jgi:hypothetical protein